MERVGEDRGGKIVKRNVGNCPLLLDQRHAPRRVAVQPHLNIGARVEPLRFSRIGKVQVHVLAIAEVEIGREVEVKVQRIGAIDLDSVGPGELV